ncbi:ATP-dependent helicase HrpB [Methylocella sp.]|uniref:ATP-dependent helicase HrpB n=1 Tax=Methylocella sp. TaxID=1978226 RepID=UPI003783A529
MPDLSAPLPIDDALPALKAALASGARCVLAAPPGAGKTTRVPLALLDEPWAAGGTVVLLDPRRLAARAAAARRAAARGESVGETIGLRTRGETKVSRRTRVEIVTEGVFARMIQSDPSLEGVALVMFDEFHERSLDADLSLALCLDAAEALREDLRLIVMSATLDVARVAALLGGAPAVVSEGRAFPVETRHLPRRPQERVEEATTAAILRALAEETGSILAFLPGQGEILRAAALLGEKVRDPEVTVAPLYAALGRAEQDRAVAPAARGRRKIVLATSIAETSLTIEGVRVVVDCGLTRAPRFDPGRGLSTLETVRVSRAAADQRRGRAGRTEPGVCYRLWEEAATGALAPFAPAEILAADLSGLTLDLAVWGAREPAALAWLDPPPAPAVKEARALLREIGALDEDGGPTPLGRRMSGFGLPPRLARMILAAAGRDAALGALACELAVVLTERGLGGDHADLSRRLERWRADGSPRAEAARRLAREGAARAGLGAQARPDVSGCGLCLALAFPDRIAKARGAGSAGEFLMANGRAAALDPAEALSREAFLAVGEIAGRAGAARLLAAAALDDAAIEAAAGAAVETRDEIAVDPQSLSLRARRRRRLGALVLAERPLPVPTDAAAARRLAEAIAADDAGFSRLPFTKALRQWLARVAFLRAAAPEEGWPDLSAAALRAGAADWLAPFVEGRAGLSAVTAQDLEDALRARLPWDLARRLDVEAPAYFETPAGSRVALDYEGERGPVLSVKVQELYGLAAHPSLAGGRAPLTLELLSPAMRPIQKTSDLPGFWRGSWAQVRTEMKGRYPRHLWPEDPASAAPTTRAKPRGA